MQLKFICPRWGSEDVPFEEFLQKAKTAGYHGVEFSLPLDKAIKKEWIRLMNAYEMIFIAQHWETHNGNFNEHKSEYQKRLLHLASAQPYFINAHTGKDYFSFEQNAELIEIANNISKETGVKIIHETHRGRFSFAAHITFSFLKQIENLHLALDLSHWCNVAESYLDDQEEAVSLAISRTEHIHARVGFPEGPQIPDPRADEWGEALAKHVAWWKRVVSMHKKKGADVLTIAPEFGPYPYMQILPNNKKPIANQWDINEYMMNYLKIELIN